MRRLVLFTVLATTVLTSVAWADNISSATAYSIAIGGTPVEALVDSGTGVVPPTDRWYSTRVSTGRSYCAETQAGVRFDPTTVQGPEVNDTVVSIYQADATTLIVSNDGISNEEPASRSLSRACFRSTLPDASQIFIRVSSDKGAFYTRMRIVDTTRYSDWFFIGGDYNAYTLIRSTINFDVIYTVEWRNLDGTIVATTTGTLTPHAGVVLDARTFVTSTIMGTVQIAHDRAESAIVASTTVLSGTTGLSFDAPFVTRHPW
jgi:hypothetical protein